MTLAFTTGPDTASAADIEYARRVAAMILGVRLLGVVSGFTRGVFQLGLEMGSVMARLAAAGKDATSPNTGVDLSGVLRLLRRALHMADAMRVRLRTPAVIAATRRKRPERRGEAKPGPPKDVRSPMAQALWGITLGRRDKEMCDKWRHVIVGMSTREVLGRIYGDLMAAAGMLGETVAATRIEKWAFRAAALLQQAEEEEVTTAAAMREAVTRPAEPVVRDAVPEAALPPDGVANSAPSRAAGCGPP